MHIFTTKRWCRHYYITSKQPSVTFDAPEVRQKLIDECYRWSNTNAMQLNTCKTETMNILLYKKLTMTTNHTVDNVHNVETVESRLLDVQIDNHLRFNSHVQSLRLACNRKSHGFFVLKKSGVSSESLVLLYKTQVLPSITHSAADRYPYATRYQQEDPTRKDMEARFENNLSGIWSLQRTFSSSQYQHAMRNTGQCPAYLVIVKSHQNHPLHNRMPKRPEGRSYFHRLNNICG